MENELISVIIPVYNSEAWIERCVRSVQNNTYQNLEIICINDGSSDNSLALLKRMQAEDDRIIVIDQKNGGVSAARNAGLKQAHGEYIAFVDSDDWVHRQYFEKLLFFGKKYNADAVCCMHNNTSEYNESSVLREAAAPSDIRVLNAKEALNFFETKGSIWGKLYRSRILQGKSFVKDMCWGEDIFFNFTVYPHADIIVYFPSHLYFYFSREASLVRSATSEKRLELCRRCLKAVDDYPALYRESLLSESVKNILSYRYENMFSSFRDRTRSECNNLFKTARSHFGYLSMKKRIIFYLFWAFPGLYRIFRIQKDRSLLVWEKQMRTGSGGQKR